MQRAEEEVGGTLLDAGDDADPAGPVPPGSHPAEETAVTWAAEAVGPKVDAACGGEGGGDFGHGEGDDEGEAGGEVSEYVSVWEDGKDLSLGGALCTYPPIMVQFAKAALGPPVYMAKLNRTGMPRQVRVSLTVSQSQRRLGQAYQRQSSWRYM